MKIKTIILILLASITFTNCSKDDDENYNFSSEKVAPGKTLVVYFSRTNNTELISNHIVALTGADVYRIAPVNAYPEDYDETTRVARQERDNNARPEIANLPENIDDYETIIIGYPVWWSSRPMIIATFLEAFDFRGKNIVPFCTHAGGNVNGTFNEVAAHTPNSTHLQGFSISGSQEVSARSSVQNWLNTIFVLE